MQTEELERCPICGEETLSTLSGRYRMKSPEDVPGGELVIENAEWEACSTCGEEILPPELICALGRERRRLLGLLAPEQIREIRVRAGLTQTQMAAMLGIGEKTLTRWETGKSAQNRSNDNLIRLLDQDPARLARIDARRDPNRRAVLKSYFSVLATIKGDCDYALAAHGIERGVTTSTAVRKRLREILRIMRERHEG